MSVHKCWLPDEQNKWITHTNQNSTCQTLDHSNHWNKAKNSRYMPTIAELSMQDYDIFHCNIETKTGRGVLLLTHTSLKATQVKSTSNFEELSSQRFHSRKRKKALIGCMYRSPNSEPENNEKLCEELRTLRNRYDTMLIMGDFNFRNINWEQNSTRRGDTTSCDHRFL